MLQLVVSLVVTLNIMAQGIRSISVRPPPAHFALSVSVCRLATVLPFSAASQPSSASPTIIAMAPRKQASASAAASSMAAGSVMPPPSSVGQRRASKRASDIEAVNRGADLLGSSSASAPLTPVPAFGQSASPGMQLVPVSAPSPAGGSTAVVPVDLGSRAMASGTGMSGSWTACWFECNTAGQTYNIGNMRCPKFACGLCNSSRKALDTQARCNKQLKLVVDDWKANKQGEYKFRVRMGRVDPQATNGQPNSIHERSALLVEFSSHLEIEASVEDNSTALWCLEAEYISYKVMWHRRSEAQAEADWKKDFNNPDIQKRSGPRIPIMGIPTTQGKIRRSVRRCIQANAYIADAEQFGTAMSRMNIQALPNLASGFGDVGGGVFKAGAVSGTDREINPQSILPSGSGAEQVSLDDVQALSLLPRASPHARMLLPRKSNPEDGAASASAAAEDTRLYAFYQHLPHSTHCHGLHTYTSAFRRDVRVAFRMQRSFHILCN